MSCDLAASVVPRPDWISGWASAPDARMQLAYVIFPLRKLSDVPPRLRSTLSIVQTFRDVCQGYTAPFCALVAGDKYSDRAGLDLARIRAIISVPDVASLGPRLHGFVPRPSGHYREAFRSRL